MREKETELKKLNEIGLNDQERLDYIREELRKVIADNKVTSKTVKTLDTLVMTLFQIRRDWSDYISQWMKQGWLIDD
jgi:hypothetical protein